MGDKEYIEQLEQALIFMCSWYQDIYNETFKDYMQERNEKYLKLPTIQGFQSRLAVKNIAKIEEDIFRNKEVNINYNFNFKEIENKLKSKYK